MTAYIWKSIIWFLIYTICISGAQWPHGYCIRYHIKKKNSPQNILLDSADLDPAGFGAVTHGSSQQDTIGHIPFSVGKQKPRMCQLHPIYFKMSLPERDEGKGSGLLQDTELRFSGEQGIPASRVSDAL